MDNYLMKEVDFQGDNLLAFKNRESDKVYVGISYIGYAVGISRKQIDHQLTKIQTDYVLSKGTEKIRYPTNGGVQETYALDVDYLPLWLAKINANIIKEDPIRQKLIAYQLKAKDVLAQAFLHRQEFKIPQTFSEALRLSAELAEQNEKLLPKAEKYDLFLTAKNSQTMSEISKVLKIGRNKLFKILREKNILLKNNTPVNKYIDSGIFEVKEVTVKRGTHIFNGCQTYVTANGVEFLHKLIHNIKFTWSEINNVIVL